VKYVFKDFFYLQVTSVVALENIYLKIPSVMSTPHSTPPRCFNSWEGRRNEWGYSKKPILTKSKYLKLIIVTRFSTTLKCPTDKTVQKD
jgi:hypothetical protein